MRTLRDVHLYLGCVFCPLLIFYAVTGAWQSFDFHNRQTHRSTATSWVMEMSRVHMNAKVMKPSIKFGGKFRYFALAMAVDLVTTSILGVILAFQVARNRWLVWASLGFGVVFPFWLVYG